MPCAARKPNVLSILLGRCCLSFPTRHALDLQCQIDQSLDARSMVFARGLIASYVRSFCGRASSKNAWLCLLCSLAPV